MKLQLQLHSQHPIPVRTAAGNGEERAAQIDRIQERLSPVASVQPSARKIPSRSNDSACLSVVIALAHAAASGRLSKRSTISSMHET